MAMLRPALRMYLHGKAACQSRGKRGDSGLAGRDARLHIVTMEVQHERLVGAPAQLDALAFGGAQYTLGRRHAALHDANLERADGGLRTFVGSDDWQRKVRAERNASRDKTRDAGEVARAACIFQRASNPCLPDRVIVA